MPRVPVITGIGLVTPLGGSAPATWAALLAGEFILDHCRSPEEDSVSADLPRVSRLAIRACREALARDAEKPRDLALIVGTSKGAVENLLDQQVDSSSNATPFDCGLSRIASDVAAAIGGIGPRLTVSAACAGGLHALIRAALLIRSGEADAVLVTAAEASVHPLFLGAFDRLGILPPRGFGCRPFDRNRHGFLVSEAAAAVLLRAGDGTADISIERFAMGADAFHLTRTGPGSLPLERVLRQVGGDEPVDLFHAHGTGTIHNDETELEVIERMQTSAGPAAHLYSHKGALGHSLGAAGLVSVVINALAHREGIVPPNVRTTEPMPAGHVRIERTAVSKPMRRSIAVAAGFGGQIAAVSLKSGSS